VPEESLQSLKAVSDIREDFKIRNVKISLNEIKSHLQMGITKFLKLFMVLTGMLLLFTQHSYSQSSTQVNIVGIPPVLTSPFADNIETNFKTGQYQVIFNYSSFSSQPVDFVFEFTLRRNNRTIIEFESLPRAFTPGSYVFSNFFEEVDFPFTPKDVLNQLDKELQNQVVQSGSIPEGNYSIEITARPNVQQSGINSMPGNSIFTVRYPPPPILVSVPDGANLLLETPTFSWTPVASSMGGLFEYEFLLVEVLRGQTPLQAINSNREHTFETLTGQTTLPYTLQYLPLEEGATYAWQVTARDANGQLPLQNDGESEIYTFTYRDKSVTEGLISELTEVILIPNFLEINGLDTVEITERPDRYILNGFASAEIDVDRSAVPVEVGVDIRNLEIQKGNLAVPIVMGGRVNFKGSDIEDIFLNSDIINIEESFWEFTSGMNAAASINIDDRNLNAEGYLNLSRSGISGFVEASGSGLFEFDQYPVSLELTRLRAQFPGNQLVADGDIRILGIDSPCDVTGINLASDVANIGFSCSELEETPLVTETSFLSIDPTFIIGNASINRSSGEFDYSLTMESKLDFEVSSDEQCYVRFQSDISSTSGIDYRPLNQNCNLWKGGINLGFAEIQLRNITLNDLSLDPDIDDWNFEIEFDSRLQIPMFEDWKSSWFTNTVISREGIQFEEQTFIRNSPTLPEMDFSGMGIRLNEFILEEFTFPAFNWDQSGPGPWEISFGGELSFQDKSGLPACMSGLKPTIQNGRISGNSVVSDISSGTLNDCQLDFGAGYSVQVEELAGNFGANWSSDIDNPEIEPFADVKIKGELKTGDPFNCFEDTSGQIVDFNFTGGGITGSFNDILPACPLNVGPFTATVEGSSLNMNWESEKGQTALLDSKLLLELPNDVKVDGEGQLDLMTGSFNKLKFALNKPFQWDIPEDNPVMSFMIEDAELTEKGLFVDGRQSLLLGEKKIGVTFDQLLLDIETLRIRNGRILFDEEFAFEASIDQTEGLLFSAVPVVEEAVLNTGLYMELGGAVVIDSTGISTSGSAKASLNYGGKRFMEDVEVKYSKDFRMSLFPFKVSSGRASIYYKDSQVAYINSQGFNPVYTYFADLIVPEKLPLPDLNTAYLKLREDGELLIDATETDEGYFSLSTLPDQVIELVIPALDPQAPPTVAGVTFEDVVISGEPGSQEFISGSLSVLVDPNQQLSNLTDRGVPLKLTTIKYGDIVPDNGQTGLYLEGDLNLFDQFLPEAGEVGFFINNGGKVHGDFNLSGLSQDIFMVPGSDRIALNISSIDGDFYTDLSSPASTMYDFDIAASLEVRDGDAMIGRSEMTMNLNQSNFMVTSFQAEVEDLPKLENEYFSFGIEKLNNSPEFNYSPETGFEFAISVDLDLQVNPSEGESFIFPLTGVEIDNSGLVIPNQTIDSATANGLSLPHFEMMGLQFKPLALRTQEPVVINWYENEYNLNIDPRFDFELRLPHFEGTGLNPEDGLTFNDIGFEDGFLVGSVNSHNFLVGVELPLGPASMNPPSLLVHSIGGSLTQEIVDGEPEQNVSINLDAELANLPRFSKPEDETQCDSPQIELNIVDGRGFSGSVTDYSFCESVNLGSLHLDVTDTDLYFEYSDGEQLAWLDGMVSVTLPTAEDEEIEVTGAASIDLFTGTLSDGSLSVNEPFLFAFGPNPDSPIFNFNLQQAVIDSSGIQFSGAGSIGSDQLSVNVEFDDLLVDLFSNTIKSGSASIESGLALEVDLNPIDFRVSNVNSLTELDSANTIRFTATNQISLSSEGLSFSGGGSAEFVFNDEEFLNLTTIFSDDFRIRLEPYSISVAQGSAGFYLDDSEDAEAVVFWDASGFRLGGGLVALLPDRIGLPVQEIAYIDLKDSDGNPLVNVVDNDDGGYTLSTGDSPIAIVIPALGENGSGLPTVSASFSLSTDDQYNIVDGSIEVTEDLGLESTYDIPVSITDLGFSNSESGLRLQASVLAELPSVFSGSSATGTLIFEQGVGASGIVTVGNFIDSWSADTDIEPLFVYNHNEDFGGEEDDQFSAKLYGVEIELGSTSSGMRLAAGLESSILTTEGSTPHSLFMTAVYSDGNWSATSDYQWPSESLKFGKTQFKPHEHDALGVTFNEDQFILNINGQILFDELFAEEFSIGVEDLQIGVDNIQSSPSLVFGLESATGQFEDQHFSFFEGALSGVFNSPAISIEGRTFLLSSASGTLSFLEENLQYENFMVSTAGDISIGNIGTDDFNLFDEYLILNGLGLSSDDGDLQLAANFEFYLPDPINQNATSSVLIRRDSNGSVAVTVDGPSFDFSETILLGSFAEFRLDEAIIDLNILAPQDSYFAATGVVLYEDEEIISFGNSANPTEEPGISFLPSNDQPLQYSITGNKKFSYAHDFFDIDIEADGVADSETSQFQVVLNGQAGLTLPGFGGKLGFEGFTIDASGVSDIGNFSGTGVLDFLEYGSVELGAFSYQEAETEEGFQITVDSASDSRNPEDAANAEQRDEMVTKLLCFGSYGSVCPGTGSAVKLSLGGESSGSEGGFKGGVEALVFYETVDGDQFFFMDRFSLEVSSIFSMQASLQYENTSGSEDPNDDGFLLRVAATGNFQLENQSIGADIIGKFENRGGLSFGLFVAARTSQPVPIVPGIVGMTEIGGGFFYNPDPDDLQFVYDNMSYEMYKHQAPSAGTEIDFAAMIYAGITIAGEGGLSMLQGQGFLELTNQSLVLDARGTALGLSGEGSIGGLQAEAKAYLSLNFDLFADNPFREIMLQGDFEANIKLDPIISGDGNLTFFASNAGNPTSESDWIWGIIGKADFTVYQIFNGNLEFLASDVGFLVDGGLGVSLGDIPVITFEANLNASIWVLSQDAEFVEMPFGGYGTADVELCVGGCLEAEVKAAFVSRGNSGLEFFGAAAACGSLPIVGETCINGWLSIKGVNNVDYGTGKSSNADLIAQAQQQKDQFEQYINELMALLNNAVGDLDNLTNPPPYTLPGSDEIAKAGYNLLTAPASDRFEWANLKRNNELNNGDLSEIPSNLEWILNELVEADPQADNNHQFYRNLVNRSEIYTAFAEFQSEDVANELGRIMGEIADLEAQAQEAFDQMLISLSTNPVSAINSVEPNSDTPPSFQVNTALAQQQANSVNDFELEMASLGLEMIEPIITIDQMVSQMDGVMYGKIGDQQPITFGPITIDLRPSIISFAKLYNTARISLEEYFAKEANSIWTEYFWAVDMQNQLNNRSSAISSDIQSLFDTTPSTVLSSISDQRDAIVNRFHILNYLSDDSDPDGFSWYPGGNPSSNVTGLYNELASPGTSDIQNVAELSVNFWYDMYALGLDRITENRTLGRKQNDEIQEPRANAIGGILNTQFNLAEAISEFYQMKSNTVMLLYGMVDNYLAAYNYIQSDDQSYYINGDELAELSNEIYESLGSQNQIPMIDIVDYFTSHRSYLEDLLMPPMITSVNVTPSRADNDYFNEVNVSWNTSHPVGTVESAVKYGTLGLGGFDGGGLPTDGFHTVGDEEQITIYAYNIYGMPEMTSENINFGLRVRGPAGNTALHTSEFSVDVLPGGSSVPAGYQALPIESQTTPPVIAYLDLDRYYDMVATPSSSSGYTWNKLGRYFEPDNSETYAYWTHSDQFIRMWALGNDEYGGLSRFEYAVGTSEGETNVVDWTMLPGQMDLYNTAESSFHFGFTEIEGQTQLLFMSPDEEYYVSVRTVNTNGMISQPLSSDVPIKYDSTPPEDIFEADPPASDQLMMLASYGTSTPVYPAVYSAPMFDPSFTQDEIDAMGESLQEPTFDIYWTESSDPESGLNRYEYIVTNAEFATQEDFEFGNHVFETDETSATIDGNNSNLTGIVDFDREAFVHVRAVNNAGGTSEILSLGPKQPNDSTSPIRPIMRIMPNGNSLALYLTKPSYDPESGLKGFQYSIGTSAGGSDVRSYPSGSEVDIEFSNSDVDQLLNFIQQMGYTTVVGFELPSFSIPLSGLPKGQELYINYMAVNNQGGKSIMRSTGPIVIDETRPYQPNVDISTSWNSISITASNLHDPESGIADVEYRIYDGDTGEPLSNWQTFMNINGVRNGLFSNTKSVDYPGKRSTGINYNVAIRVRNPFGMSRTGYYILPPPPQSSPRAR
jgi:large repetitive protein